MYLAMWFDRFVVVIRLTIFQMEGMTHLTVLIWSRIRNKTLATKCNRKLFSAHPFPEPQAYDV